MPKLEVENALLRKDVERLEEELAAAQNKPFFNFSTFADTIKTISLPLALIGALVLAWDEYVLVWFGKDTASVASATDRMRELQQLEAKTSQLIAGQAVDEAVAVEIAQLGLKQRLVEDSFAYWEQRPEFHNSEESRILAKELKEFGKTQEAMKVAATLDSAATNPEQRALLALFRAQLYAADGNAFDLEAARNEIRTAVSHADQIEASARKTTTFATIVRYRVTIELWYGQDCEKNRAARRSDERNPLVRHRT